MKIFLGITGILFSVGAIFTGVFYPSKYLLTVALSASAFLILLVLFIANFRAVKSFSGRRATQLGVNSVLMVIFFVFLFVMLNLIIGQYYFRYDLSSTKKFTLSSQTENVVRGLEGELSVFAFVQGRGAIYEKTRAMLEGYRYLNRQMTVGVYDLDTVPSLAQRYGVDEYNTAVIVFGMRHVRVDGIDEENITNGIIRISRKGKIIVYFVRGHGERQISDEGRNGINKAADSLLNMGYDLKELNLTSVDELPKDADVLIIAGPKVEFSEHEIALLNAFIEDGQLLLMLDKEGYHFDRFLEGFSIELYNGIVTDPVNRMAGSDETVPIVSNYPVSPITRGFGLTTVFPTTMALSDDFLLRKYFDYVKVVESSKDSVIRLEDARPGSVDGIKGPLTLAILVKSRKAAGRLILFGDSDFISNKFIDVSGNGNLLRNVVSFLIGETDLVSIAPSKTEFIPLYITGAQAKTVMYVFMLGLPLLVGIAGIAVWLRRRSL